jgi:hypothetical protein
MRKQTETEAVSLLDKTRQLLKESNSSYNTIFLATGLKPHWLTFVATGKLKDPSVNKIQKLYEHLTGQKLAV